MISKESAKEPSGRGGQLKRRDHPHYEELTSTTLWSFRRVKWRSKEGNEEGNEKEEKKEKGRKGKKKVGEGSQVELERFVVSKKRASELFLNELFPSQLRLLSFSIFSPSLSSSFSLRLPRVYLFFSLFLWLSSYTRPIQLPRLLLQFTSPSVETLIAVRTSRYIFKPTESLHRWRQRRRWRRQRSRRRYRSWYKITNLFVNRDTAFEKRS